MEHHATSELLKRASGESSKETMPPRRHGEKRSSPLVDDMGRIVRPGEFASCLVARGMSARFRFFHDFSRRYRERDDFRIPNGPEDDGGYENT